MLFSKCGLCPAGHFFSEQCPTPNNSLFSELALLLYSKTTFQWLFTCTCLAVAFQQADTFSSNVRLAFQQGTVTLAPSASSALVLFVQ